MSSSDFMFIYWERHFFSFLCWNYLKFTLNWSICRKWCISHTMYAEQKKTISSSMSMLSTWLKHCYAPTYTITAETREDDCVTCYPCGRYCVSVVLHYTTVFIHILYIVLTILVYLRLNFILIGNCNSVNWNGFGWREWNGSIKCKRSE